MRTKSRKIYAGIWALAIPLVAALVTSSNAQQPKRKSSSKSASTISSSDSSSDFMPMPIVAPLFLEGRGFTSTVVLINPIAQPISEEVSLRETDGTEIADKEITLQPRSQMRLAVADWIASSPSTLQAGSVLVMPKDYPATTVAALLSIEFGDKDSPSYVDEEFAMPSVHSSPTLRGVALESSGDPILGVTSLSPNPQTISISCTSEVGVTKKEIRLQPNATAMTRSCQAGPDTEKLPALDARNGIQHEGIRATGISLQSDGEPGSYAAFGITRRENDRVKGIGAVAFLDPETMQSGTTVFPGVAVGSISTLQGHYTPEVAVANFGNAAAKITVTYAKSGADGSVEPAVRTVREFSLGPDQAQAVHIDDLDGSPDMSDSIVVSSTAAPGDILATLASVSKGPIGQMFVQGHDESGPDNGGKHPWMLGANSDSDATLLLFNHSSESQKFTVSIGKNGVLWGKTLTLSSMQTSAISIRTLIEKKVKDDSGRTLPPSVQDGEITWHTPGSGQGKGRLFESSNAPLTARSFSCTGELSLCSGSGIMGSPTSISILVGGSGGLGFIVGDECNSGDPYTSTGCSCCDDGMQYYGYYTFSGCSHASGCDTGSFLGLSAGTDTITETLNDGYGCSTQANGTVKVQVPTSLSKVSVTVLSGSSQCPADAPSNYTYGLYVTVIYQVLDQDGIAITSSQMEPQETDTNEYVNGQHKPDPVPSWSDFVVGTYTDSSGRFPDTPLGTCAEAGFTMADTQSISVLLNGNRYVLRTNGWTTSSSSSGHGSITNSNDISASR